MTMSDRFAVMRDGVILQMGRPMEIYNRPNSRFVADFIGESNVFEGTVRAARDGLLTVETPEGLLTTAGEGFAPGEELYVSIRPEALNVSRRAREGFSLPGRIKDFIYMGTVVKTSLDMPGGRELKYSRFETDPDLREGDEVFAWWDPAKSVAIRKEPAPAEARA